MTKILATDRIHKLPFIRPTPSALVMDTTYFLQGIIFEWDENKARSNVRKHGVTFEEAAELFFDPFYQTGDASTDEEQRDIIIMKQPSEQVTKTDEGFELQLRPRPATAVSLRIPDDTLASLEKLAAGRDMSAEALMRFYIGQGLRQDLAKVYADQLLEKTAQVLTHHIQSEEEVSAILQEIRVETVV